ncbi:MAG: DUF3293 domain-containing protein [Phycisphaeraceae bacterium]|nr:DUF3293 domain-containing protein [Phycisphaeraceae bacterium]
MTEADLEQAYRRTRYRAELPIGPVVIRIGQPTPALDQWLADEDFHDWAFLTAANPFSRPTDPDTNAARQAQLADRLRKDGWRFYTGEGIPDEGDDWSAEPSWMVVDIDPDTAMAIAREFNQNAIVTGRCGEPARLTWCRATG